MTSILRRAPFAAGLALGASALVCLSACRSSVASRPPATEPGMTHVDQQPAAASPAAKPVYGTFGFDTAGMNRSVAPGESFYGYANGAWLEKATIPPDRSSYGMFTELLEEASRRTRELIEGASGTPGDEARKIADAYAAFMDEATIESRGVAPLQPELDAIAAIKDRGQLATALGGTLRADVDALNTGDVTTDRLFGLWVTEDLNDPTRYAPYLLQGGLGLPDRDFYLKGDARYKEIRDKYQGHIAALLRLAKVADADAEARARRIVELERKIARAHWSQVDTREITKTNNPWPRDAFAGKAPGLDWKRFFEAAGLGAQELFMVWQPSALRGIARLVGSQPLATWKDYLAFHAVSRAAPFLSRAFVDESFAFQGKVLSGAQQLPERWKRAVEFASEAMGEAVGKLYVAKYFPPAAKAEADRMVQNIVAAFGQRIDSLAWMAPETKVRAKEKLATLQVGIGHPPSWRDYGALTIKRDDAYGNAERAGRFEYERALAKLGRPVDRTEWYLLPQVVNALNSPQQNSIIFPAAILQPPFFDPAADPAVNYGGIGMVIGHEIVHSFDDIGAQFDANGKLANWWTKADADRFKAAGQALAAQYSAYKPFPDLAVNGDLTLGENIADVAGIAIAYDGYHRSLGGKEPPVLDGFTGDQRFYLGFAQIWRRKDREPALRQALLTDGHSPAEYRAAAVRNQDSWYAAFDAKPGQALYLEPDRRVRVW